MSNNPPKKHHYIPKFYTKRWSGTAGKLVEFSRPHKKTIYHRWVHPDQTGYLNRLYELRGLPPVTAQKIESIFFKTLDDYASKALDSLLANSPLSARQKQALSQFHRSLMMRCPEDIRALREDYAKRFFLLFAQMSRSADTIEQVAAVKMLSLEIFEENYFTIYTDIINGDNPSGRFMASMDWYIIDVASAKRPLLTSDRPILSLPSGTRRSTIGLPISPSAVAVSTHVAADVDFLRAMEPDRLVGQCNEQVITHAASYVYAADLREIEYVTLKFGLNPQPRAATYRKPERVQ